MRSLVHRAVLAGVAAVCALVGVLAFAGASALAAEPEAPETGTASAITATSASVGGVLNPNAPGEPGVYFFLYAPRGAACTEGAMAPESPLAALGEEKEAVSPPVELSGLEPGTQYTYCLVAKNAAEESAIGPPKTFTTLAATPAVVAESESVTEVTSESAKLNAEIDPGGGETTFRFEYGPTVEYGQSTPVSGSIGADNSDHPAAAQIQGLQPGTTYHYRVMASNSSAPGGVPGPDMTFTTQAMGGEFALPDGRAWELVSPPDKQGAEVTTIRFGAGGEMQAAEDGEAVTYVTNAPVGANPPSNPIETQLFSKRVSGSSAWVTQDIATPHQKASSLEWTERGGVVIRLQQAGEYLVFSPDLSLAYVDPEGDTQLAPPPPKLTPLQHNLGGYVRDDNTGGFKRTEMSAEEWYAEQVALAQGPPRCEASSSPAKGEGVDAVSVDGCYVYFNSEAILVPGASGPDPLYVAHDEGGVWTTTFISSLSGIEDAVPWVNVVGVEGSLASLELSPNGRYVAFMSTLSLTGYDNRDAVTGQRDEEVYLYDAGINRLVCASCNPTGARPMGQLDTEINESKANNALMVDRDSNWVEQRLAGVLPAPPLRQYRNGLEPELFMLRQPRYLSDGGRLFFDSPIGLVPQDVNGQEDVYEYEPQGEGTCGDPGGCVSLISSGTSSGESALVEASANGNDVFFLAGDRLVGQDYDSVYDMYDAHVCSAGVPCPSPSVVAPPPCSTGDSCKPAPSAQPAVFGAPPSATFSGAGNPVRAVSKPVVKRKPNRRVVRKHTKKRVKGNQRRSK